MENMGDAHAPSELVASCCGLRELGHSDHSLSRQPTGSTDAPSDDGVVSLSCECGGVSVEVFVDDRSQTTSTDTPASNLTSSVWDEQGEVEPLCLPGCILSPRSPTTPGLGRKTQRNRSCSSPSVASSSSSRWRDPSETLILLDWDDTLCPTTSCTKLLDGRSPSTTEKQELQAHEAAVINLLLAAAELGHIAIVTMAMKAHVTRSIEELMPGVADVLKELKIEVVSARDSIAQRFRRSARSDDRDPSQYLKTKAMERVIKNFYSRGGKMSKIVGASRQRCWKNIVSIGDSCAERLALQDLVFRREQRSSGGDWKECHCKTLLLLPEPSLVQLTKELRVMIPLLSVLVRHDDDIHVDMDEDDLERDPSMMEPCAA